MLIPRGFASDWCAVGLVLGCLSAAPAMEPPLERFTATQPQMGVPFTIILYAADQCAANAAFDAAFERIAALNRVMSDYDPASELSRLGRASPTAQPVVVSDDLWRVLLASQQLAARSDGAFDITVGPYVRLWRRARRQQAMPSPERLAEARAAVGYTKLALDPARKTAMLSAAGMRLDLGGIARGYAVDEALAVLRAHGISAALVDASGDIGVTDPPPGERGWTVRVDPLAAGAGQGRSICLANMAVTTSGDAYQFVEIDGRRYSHIVDPRTGLGLVDRSGVTVIAPDCLAADSLATAVSVLGAQAGLRLIEQTSGAAAFIVRAGASGRPPETFASPGFERYVVATSDGDP